MHRTSCPLCLGRTAKITESITVKYLRVTFTLSGIERSRCSICKEEFFDLEQAARYSQAAKQAYKAYATLTGADVARIRGKLKLSQADFEKRLGLGAKVVVRWENGKVRLPGPVNVLLKILDKRPNVLKLI